MDASDVTALRTARTLASCSTADDWLMSWGNFLPGIGLPTRRRSDSFASKNHETQHQSNLNFLDLAHDAVCVRNMSGVVEYWNRAAERLYGWTADEAVGRVGHALLKTIFTAPFANIEAEVLRTGRWEGELVHMLKDGTRVTVASRWCLLRDEASQPIAILEINHDINERKRAQVAQRKVEKPLPPPQSEQLDAIARLTNDFNNVLGGIMAFGEMLFDEAADNTPQKRHAQNVLTAATRGRELIHRFSNGALTGM